MVGSVMISVALVSKLHTKGESRTGQINCGDASLHCLGV